MSHPFIVGEFYTRRQIADICKGGLEIYLPNVNGKVTCACLRTDKNPNAPLETLVGNRPKVVRAAKLLNNQVGEMIPVFMFDCSNSWRYEGMYEVVSYSTDAEVIRKACIGSGRPNIAGVITLKPEVAPC